MSFKHDRTFLLPRAAARLLAGLGVLCCCILLTAHAQAQPLAPVAAGNTYDGPIVDAAEPGILRIVTGKSLILNTRAPVRRVSIASSECAELIMISPRQLYLTGKKPGMTNLTMWGRDGGIVGVYDLQIAPDVTLLKKRLHEVLPDENGIKVMPSGDFITLSGEVSSASALTTALSMAEPFAPKKIVNVMSVGGVQQVMLEVKVAEMSRVALKRLGVNFAGSSNGDQFYSFLNNLTGLDPDKGVINMSSKIQGVIRTTIGGTVLDVFLDALKKDGLVKILAEPNLVCISGETANFLAGGELPIPLPQALGTVAVDWKPFGVGLQFTPVVLSDKHINLKVQPEVSDLDYSRAISYDGFEIPAISTRRSTTTIELGDGQSFAIAGLIKDTLRENVNKFPYLGDLPVLGPLFRSSDFEKNQTELIIIVTPHLVKPLDMAKQTLPTDGFKEPSDFEFYALGQLEGGTFGGAAGAMNRKANPAPVAAPSGDGGFDGEYGHSVPQ